MANKIALLDTSILIDLFGKIDKANSALISLVRQDFVYIISIVTKYEIYTDAISGQIDLLDKCAVYLAVRMEWPLHL